MLKSVLRLALGSVLFAFGCQNENDLKEFDANEIKPPDAPAGHPTEGPHKGELVELGNEEYHAEFLHDEETGTVTIYILDDHATKMVPIDATELTINLKHDGKPLQYTLAASRDDSDPEGKCSRFMLTDKELVEYIEEDGADPELKVMIDGKQFSGEINHSHSHD